MLTSELLSDVSVIASNIPELYYLGTPTPSDYGYATLDVWLIGTHPDYSKSPLGFRLCIYPGNQVEDIVLLTPFLHSTFETNSCNDSFFEPLSGHPSTLETIRRLVDLLSKADPMSSSHATMIANMTRYIPFAKHPELFLKEKAPWPLDRHWLSREVEGVLRGDTSWESILTQETEGVYSFTLFTPEFCKLLIEEFDHYEEWSKENNVRIRRPNSMNNYGSIMSYMGLSPLIRALQETILTPLSALKFPLEATFGGGFTSFHAFQIQYAVGRDKGLDMHTDQSDVTFNVCLGRDFTGSTLTFCGLLGSRQHRKFRTSYSHVPTRCVFHLGRHRHGADDIATGERVNLVIWNENLPFQSSGHPNFVWPGEDGVDAVCTSFTYDKDFDQYKPYPPGTEHFKETAWCPHPEGVLTRFC
eukprot:PhF_6_TR15660/c0_g1_i1/m.24335